MKTAEFIDTLKFIFKSDFTYKVFIQNKDLTKVKLNISRAIQTGEIRALLELADESGLDMYIKRSGEGIKIEFLQLEAVEV